MSRSARRKTEYAFLDSYAELIERLLPTVRAVGFFDFRGEPLRGRGPVPLLQTSQVRAMLKSAIHSEGHAPEALVPLSARECAAVLALTAGSGARPDPQRSPPVTGVCLMVIHVPDGAPPPSLQSLHVELDPALACIGHHLAAHAPSGGRGLAEEETTHLEWLFEVTTPAVHAEGAPVSPDRGERLAQMMAASVAHLQCILGALLVPERHLRIVRTAGGSRHAVEEALGRLEPPVLTWVRRKNRPMVINQSMRWSAGRGDGKPSSPLRLLAVPIRLADMRVRRRARCFCCARRTPPRSPADSWLWSGTSAATSRRCSRPILTS
jgi:hypothetical protein